MQRLLFVIACGTLLAGTLASGLVHWRFASPWGNAAALKQAQARLHRALPARLGPWRLAKTHEIDQKVAKQLQSSTYLHAVYTNDQTGDSVIVAVVAGPSGPISVHTPEICYSSSDYEIAGDRKEIKLSDDHGRTHALWQVHANSRDSNNPNLRILYGWSRGESWQAPTSPRFTYAGLPVLYKLQLAGPPRDNQQDPDPCLDFLSRFMTQLQPRLVTTERTAFLIH